MSSPADYMAPAPAPAPKHHADRVGAALVVVGSLIHDVGAHILKARNEQLAEELESARADARILASHAYALGREHQATGHAIPDDVPAAAAAAVDEHQDHEPADDVCEACGRTVGSVTFPPCNDCPDAADAAELGARAAELGHQGDELADVGGPRTVSRILAGLRGRGPVDEHRNDEVAGELGELGERRGAEFEDHRI